MNAQTKQTTDHNSEVKVPYDKWLTALRAVFACEVCLCSESWRDYYEDGMTPEEAFAEDMSHG